MKMAYADPPYLGQAKKHYGKFGGSEVDHRLLVARLELDYPDGWALSLSSPSLRQILALCPSDVRVMAWVKPFASFKPHVNPGYCWEPVIVRGGRQRTREQDTVRDYISANITLRRGMPGAKPDAFCYWLFEVLNLQPGDELADLFPGSGAVTRAYERWIGRFSSAPSSCGTTDTGRSNSQSGLLLPPTQTLERGECGEPE